MPGVKKHRGRVASALGVGLFVVALVGGACSADTEKRAAEKPSLESALVEAGDLPEPAWETFEVASSEVPKPRRCGEVVDAPSPLESARTAFSRDPDDGPIFGERIERYAAGQAERRLEANQLDTASCDWQDEQGRWTTTVVPVQIHGDESRAILITSRDRPDSFNYSVAMRQGDTNVLVSLNSRTADPDLLNELAEVAWSKARASGLVK